MDISEKIKLNKRIRKYDGSNSFINSLKKNLSSKFCKKEKLGDKEYKILTDKQYDAAKSFFGKDLED
jgi:hypothetical protein